ncbi:MAG: hypothetical protein L0Y35_07210 [Flammeovirgaceae bacterium]|nr:hypothetical protein [Flammeovirgaceae bacterium]
MSTAMSARFFPCLPTKLLYFLFKKVSLVWEAAEAASVSVVFRDLFPWVMRSLFFASTLIIAGTHACPRSQVLMVGEYVRVGVYFG